MYDHYLDQLEERYRSLWTVKRDVLINDWKIDILSRFVAKYERYVLTKKAKIGGAETHIFDIVTHVPQDFDLENLLQMEKMGKDFIQKEVKPSFERMCTEVRLVVIGVGHSEDTIQFARRYKYTKNFLMGLKGWCTLTFILVDMQNGAVYSHRGLTDKDRDMYKP